MGLEFRLPPCTRSYENPCPIFDPKDRNFGKNPSEDGLKIDHVPYHQNFGSSFVENLSVIDLLFNQGPQSLDILNDMSIRYELNNEEKVLK